MSKNIWEISVKIKTEIDDKDSKEKLKKLENHRPKIQVDADTSKAQAKIKNITKTEKKNIKIEADDKPALGVFWNLKNVFSSLGNSGKIAMWGFISAMITGFWSAYEMASGVISKICK